MLEMIKRLEAAGVIKVNEDSAYRFRPDVIPHDNDIHYRVDLNYRLEIDGYRVVALKHSGYNESQWISTIHGDVYTNIQPTYKVFKLIEV
jgi:hypothetical protein